MKLIASMVLLTLSLSMAPGAQPSDDGWPQWGGPNRDFTVETGGLADKWPEDGPRSLWHRELGSGYSAMVDAMQKEFSIDADRIYVTGLSMGGFGTWDVIQRHPERFAAAVPICGGGDPAHAEQIAQVPIWAYHGDNDAVVKVERSRDMIAAIKDSGGTPRYTELPGVGHDSWTAAYTSPDLYAWMFAQTRSD